MKKYKWTIESWLPSKDNGNPHFWAIDILPQIQIQRLDKGEYLIVLGWLFWTIIYEKKEII